MYCPTTPGRRAPDRSWPATTPRQRASPGSHPARAGRSSRDRAGPLVVGTNARRTPAAALAAGSSRPTRASTACGASSRVERVASNAARAPAATETMSTTAMPTPSTTRSAWNPRSGSAVRATPRGSSGDKAMARAAVPTAPIAPTRNPCRAPLAAMVDRVIPRKPSTWSSAAASPASRRKNCITTTTAAPPTTTAISQSTPASTRRSLRTPTASSRIDPRSRPALPRLRPLRESPRFPSGSDHGVAPRDSRWSSRSDPRAP